MHYTPFPMFSPIPRVHLQVLEERGDRGLADLTRVRFRWQLAYTLAMNPSVRAMRDHAFDAELDPGLLVKVTSSLRTLTFPLTGKASEVVASSDEAQGEVAAAAADAANAQDAGSTSTLTLNPLSGREQAAPGAGAAATGDPVRASPQSSPRSGPPALPDSGSPTPATR